MVDTTEPFSPEYLPDPGTESEDRYPPPQAVPLVDSTVDKGPLKIDTPRYGTGKPRREIIRTKVIE